MLYNYFGIVINPDILCIFHTRIYVWTGKTTTAFYRPCNDVRLVRLSGERCGNYSIVLLVATHLNILYNSWIMLNNTDGLLLVESTL
jgi:hypothetical protein